MKSILFYGKKIDIFSKPITFMLDGEDKFKTWWGVFFSVITLVTTVTLAFLFGREVYERKTPVTSLSTTFVDDSKVDFYEFPYFIMLSDGLGNRKDDIFQYMSIKIQNWHYENNAFQNIYEGHKLVPCEKSHFTPFHGKISEDIIDNYLDTLPLFCIEWDKGENYAHNPYKGTNSTFILMTYRFCNKTSEICPDDMHIVEAESYIQFYYMDTYVDHQDYANPVKYYFNSINQQMSANFLKRNFIRFTLSEYISDNGWLLEEKMHTTFYSLQSIKLEINSVPVDDMQAGDIYWITIESPQVKTLYFRNYLKIQDLFAKIGGLINAIMILVNVMTMHLMKFLFFKHVRNNIEVMNISNMKDKYLFFEYPEIEKGINYINKTNLALMNKKGFGPGQQVQSNPSDNFNIHSSHIEMPSKNNYVNLQNQNSKKEDDNSKNNIIPKLKPMQTSQLLSQKSIRFNKNDGYNMWKFANIDVEDYGYLEYICSYICFNHEKKKKYKTMLGETKQLLDFDILTHHLTTMYYDEFNMLKAFDQEQQL